MNVGKFLFAVVLSAIDQLLWVVRLHQDLRPFETASQQMTVLGTLCIALGIAVPVLVALIISSAAPSIPYIVVVSSAMTIYLFIGVFAQLAFYDEFAGRFIKNRFA